MNCTDSTTIFMITMMTLLAFANCESEIEKPDNHSTNIKKGLVIDESMKFPKGNYHLVTDDINRKIITIEGDSLTVDFNYSTLVGTDDFTKPDQFKGIGIHIKNSKFVTIKNLKLSGYFIGLQIDSVQYLTIDNCHFEYNYHADSTRHFDIQKVKNGAITINNSKVIDIQNSTISHNENAIVLNNSVLTSLNDSKIQFNSKVGLYVNNSILGEIYRNQIDWNLVAANWYQNSQNLGSYIANSMTHNGKINTLERWYNSNDFAFSEIDLTTNLNLSEYEKEKARMPKLNPKYPKGKAYKLPTKYGIYDFEYPAVFFEN